MPRSVGRSSSISWKVLAATRKRWRDRVIHRLTRDEARRMVVRAPLLDADRPGDALEVAT